ncbi:MAG: HEAT repeat domain-containing protein [Pirellulales bacterium]|nr:HEAT repeat domain-containing protein [Pirellulales bacterium]
MGFKTDREFLRNITVGAIGTRQVAKLLNAAGFRIIELERTAISNKLWMTKIKRLRVPDLLCLHSGTRIESRAKGTLKVTMSHAIKNADRAWDKGLRDKDLVAFIKCYDQDGHWEPADTVCLFRVSDMRATQDVAGLSQMKSAAEGNEIQLTWPSTIPKQAGHVEAIEPDKIKTVLASGRRQSYKLISKKKGGVKCILTPYVNVGDVFVGDEQVIASVMPELVELAAPDCDQYDFIADLEEDDHETVYAASKALGYLPELKSQSEQPLRTVMNDDSNPLLQLEAASALARLGINDGWDGIASAAKSDRDDVKMEAVLILGELPGQKPLGMMKEIAANTSSPSELRAACAWAMGEHSYDLLQTPLLDLIADDDEDVATHAIVSASRLITDDNIADVLAQIGDNAKKSAGIARSVVLSSSNPVPIIVNAIENTDGASRNWLIYLLARLGIQKSEAYVRDNANHLLSELDFFWKYHEENWTNRLDVADQLDFLTAQYL